MTGTQKRKEFRQDRPGLNHAGNGDVLARGDLELSAAIVQQRRNIDAGSKEAA